MFRHLPHSSTLSRAAALILSTLLFALALATAMAGTAAAKSTTSADPRLTVTVLLSQSSLLADLTPAARRQMARPPETAAARRAAQNNPFRFSKAERSVARAAEAQRNRALPALQRAAARGLRQSDRVARLIKSLGGRVIATSPLPNQITASLPSAALATLEQSPDVQSIQPAQLPVSHASPYTGAPTWHSNGFTGDGPSLDGNGGPDFVVLQESVRTTHEAFRTRMPGDCPTCNGSGPSRIISPAGRTNFNGGSGGHGNTIAAAVASTAFQTSTSGIAYGIDKLYNTYQAKNDYLWQLGVTASGEVGLGGTGDLPEAINYSAGIYQDTVDIDPYTHYFDALSPNFGILQTVSAGNCGKADSIYTGCNAANPGVTHRVSAPGTNPNVLTVGGLDSTTTYPDTSGYFPWENSSPGPTWGGRKKPDLITFPYGGAGGPMSTGDSNWGNTGQGTSYAAPDAAAGGLLLASTGVYAPTAQKAILINTATAVAGQTYWRPRSGWGALNLTDAFYQRGNYASSSVHGVGVNSARFFRVDNVAPGDRATLVWDKRTFGGSLLDPNYVDTTNLDLSQIDPADPAGATITSTGGSDAADAVDTDQTVTTENPMPGNGQDGEDVVEQIRSTVSSAQQLLKVKAHSAVASAEVEPFSVASAKPITQLSTPIPSLEATPSTSLATVGTQVTITVTAENPSNDLPLNSANATVDGLPAGISVVGSSSVNLGNIAPGASAGTTFTVQGNTDGIKELAISIAGTTYGEAFGATDELQITFDGTPPTLHLTQLPEWSTSATPAADWSAEDELAGVDSYDAEVQIDGGAWNRLINAGGDTSLQLAGAQEGQNISVRVRARDELGNTSDWATATTTVDAIEPDIAIGAANFPAVGTITVPVSVTNVGAPVSATTYELRLYTYSNPIPLAGPLVTYTNPTGSHLSPTLTVTATDALGRTVTRSQRYSLPPAPAATKRSTRLTLSKPKIKRRQLTVSGSIAPKVSGRVTVTISPKSKGASRRTHKSLRLSGGKFRHTKKLRRGKYSVQVRFGGSATHKASSTSRTIRVR